MQRTREPGDAVRGWLTSLFVTAVALVLRLRDLGNPKRLMFDETYYVKDAWSLLQYGYSRDGVEDADELIEIGHLAEAFSDDPTWVVHPDGGKWMIAFGEWLFGLNSFGWRFSAALAGSLLVLVLVRLAGRLTGSWFIAGATGLLLAVDGMGLVMSRIALLDIFLALWTLCTVAALVADRDWIAARLDDDKIPLLRPWQLAAGVCAGLAVSTKWSALTVVAVFGVAVVVWEMVLRGHTGTFAAGVIRLLRIGVPAFLSIVVVGFVVYLVTWSSWLANHEVFEDHFGHGYGDDPVWTHLADDETGRADALFSLWHFHKMTYEFHTGDYMAEQTHPYQSNPAGWLLQIRPTSVDTVTDIDPDSCGAPEDSSCISEVLILGNPIVWWSAALGLPFLLFAWWRTRSWRWSVPVLGVLATWLPWFFVGSRPIYSFYAITILPFSLLGLGMLFAWFAESPKRKPFALGALGMLVILAAVAAWWFWPLWTNGLLPYDSWRSRMWFNSWI